MLDRLLLLFLKVPVKKPKATSKVPIYLIIVRRIIIYESNIKTVVQSSSVKEIKELKWRIEGKKVWKILNNIYLATETSLNSSILAIIPQLTGSVKLQEKIL